MNEKYALNDNESFFINSFYAPLYNRDMEETLIRIIDWIDSQELNETFKNNIKKFVNETIVINKNLCETIEFNKVKYIKTNNAYRKINKCIKVSVIEAIAIYPIFTSITQNCVLSMMRYVKSLFYINDYYNFIYYFLLDYYRANILLEKIVR